MLMKCLGQITWTGLMRALWKPGKRPKVSKDSLIRGLEISSFGPPPVDFRAESLVCVCGSRVVLLKRVKKLAWYPVKI